MWCLLDILIYYFSPYSQHSMLDKSSPLQTLPAPAPSALNHPSALEAKSLAALRSHFAQWIRSLAMEERFVAVKVHLPQVAVLVRSVCGRAERPCCQGEHQQRDQRQADFRRFSRKYEKNFYESLVFLSDGHSFLDHICFDFALLDAPEKLFDLLVPSSDPVGGRSLGELLSCRVELRCLNQRLQNASSREELSYQLFLFLRQEVLANFVLFTRNPEAVGKALEEERKRKKQFNNNWKLMTQQGRQKFLLLGKKDVESLLEWLSDKGMSLKQSQLQREMQELLRLQKNDFCNRIFKCKLKKLLSPVAAYYEMIYHEWKKEVDRTRKKRPAKHARTEREFSSQQKNQSKETSRQNHNRKYKKPRKANSVESNQTNQTENPKNCIEKKQSEGYGGTKKEDCLADETDDAGPLMKEEQEWVKVEQRKPQINPQVEYLQNFTIPKKPVSISSTSTKLSSKNSESQLECQRLQQMKQHLRSTSISKLNEQLQQIADRISEQANEYHDRRVIAFQRIQFLLQFYSIQIKLFGSCASGIAVRNSDIDIAIDNSILLFMDFLPEAEKIRAALQRLEEVFQSQPWITEIKFIKTAAIPLIKLTIDTSLPFFDPSIGPMYYQLNRQHNCGPINADITVETKNKSQQCSHLGLISTNAINQWLQQISSLHSIIIILKEFFAKRKLNCTYEGGLNTFSMIVLLVAYIFHAKLEEQENAALVFERILRFYVQEFDERERGIDILNRDTGNIFYIKNLVNVEGAANKLSKQKADLQIKDPMNQQKNMTRNCYSFHAIKALFREMLDGCFRRGYLELEQLAKGTEEEECKIPMTEMAREAFAKRNVFIEFLESSN